MGPDFAVVTAIQGLSAVLVFGIIGWTVVAFARARHGGGARLLELPAASLRPLEERMERLEQVNEAIALQVERMAEGQRFVTKLLSDGRSAEMIVPARKSANDVL
jgi:hypothetical protein